MLTAQTLICLLRLAWLSSRFFTSHSSTFLLPSYGITTNLDLSIGSASCLYRPNSLALYTFKSSLYSLRLYYVFCSDSALSDR